MQHKDRKTLPFKNHKQKNAQENKRKNLSTQGYQQISL